MILLPTALCQGLDYNVQATVQGPSERDHDRIQSGLFPLTRQANAYMALDPPTMLTISVALAAAAALYLAIEWRSVRETSLLYWSAGFATITVGSTLALLRGIGSVSYTHLTLPTILLV